MTFEGYYNYYHLFVAAGALTVYQVLMFLQECNNIVVQCWLYLIYSNDSDLVEKAVLKR
jgi:hypothetical protein